MCVLSQLCFPSPFLPLRWGFEVQIWERSGSEVPNEPEERGTQLGDLSYVFFLVAEAKLWS